MFTNLKSLVAEAKAEADKLIGAFGGEITGLEGEVKGLVSLFKGAQASIKKTVADAGALGSDLKTDVADALTFKTAVQADVGAFTLQVESLTPIAVGASVTGNGIAIGTLVDSFDAALGHIGLSVPTLAEIAAGQIITIAGGAPQ